MAIATRLFFKRLQLSTMSFFLLTLVLASMLSSERFVPVVVTQSAQPLFRDADCLAALPSATAYCTLREAQILATTVQIEVRNWLVYEAGVGYVNRYGRGHGTVQAGRYLVTHNHFASMTYDYYAQGALKETATLTLYNAEGQSIAALEGATLSIVEMMDEMLVIDFGAGFFDALAIDSAEFAKPTVFSGDVIAQLNWDETRSYVEWAQIRRVRVHANSRAIELNNVVIEGASGGGIFWNGQHIANNWKVVSSVHIETGRVSGAYTVAALNG